MRRDLKVGDIVTMRDDNHNRTIGLYGRFIGEGYGVVQSELGEGCVDVVFTTGTAVGASQDRFDHIGDLAQLAIVASGECVTE